MSVSLPNLDILTTPLLEGVQHGFFTRAGGVSTGVFAGLNCGVGSSDTPEMVAMNRKYVADAMGVSLQNLVTLHQVHSKDVVVVCAPLSERPRADGVVTTVPGLALAVLTADCQPVLFSDPNAGVIGAAHAGWRGAFDGVLEATIDTMERCGARRAHIKAVIGPAISQRNYEVGAEFFEQFRNVDEDNVRFFVQGENNKYHFDLTGYGLMRLRAAGIGGADWTGQCTYADDTRFYSYRRATHRDEPDYGRLISAIRL